MINVTKLNKIDFLVLIAIIIIGLIHLPFPFDGDQAFFRLGAFEIQQGKVLYRDFWDVKQPGIFYFYFLGGSFFGFNEIGIHVFELIYMVFFSLILLLTLKSYFQHRIIASLVPLLTVGVYYTVSGSWHLTQVEALVNFPLFICLWLTYQSFKYEGKQRFILLLVSGFIGGIVLIFKLIFLVVLLSFWLTPLVYFILIKREKIQKVFVEICLATFIGIMFPILFVVSYFAWFNSLSILYETFFLYPPQIVANAQFDPRRLFSGIKWFLNGFYPLILAAIIAIDISLRKFKNILTLLLVVWCIFDWGVIFLQRGAFWEYHISLLIMFSRVSSKKISQQCWNLLSKDTVFYVKIIMGFGISFYNLYQSLALVSSQTSNSKSWR